MRQNLNALLTQMDGFADNSGVLILAATNYGVEALDEALVRPGRFDKHVTMTVPDRKGREGILRLYGGKTAAGKDVDYALLARGTVGMSGAELFSVVNQAALRGAVLGMTEISHAIFEWAKG